LHTIEFVYNAGPENKFVIWCCFFYYLTSSYVTFTFILWNCWK